jgi:hypothetical protein
LGKGKHRSNEKKKKKWKWKIKTQKRIRMNILLLYHSATHKYCTRARTFLLIFVILCGFIFFIIVDVVVAVIHKSPFSNQVTQLPRPRDHNIIILQWSRYIRRWVHGRNKCTGNFSCLYIFFSARRRACMRRTVYTYNNTRVWI